MIRASLVFGACGVLLASCGGGTLAAPAPGTAAAPARRDNPFAGARFHVSAEFSAEVEAAAARAPSDAARLRKVEGLATAVWLDSIEKARVARRVLDEARAEQARSGQPVATVFVLYDLPGRDCAAVASSGELALGPGEARYRTEFIDPLAAAFRAHEGQPIVAIVEPDSLANVATNLAVPRCAASEQAYRHAIAYAVKALALPHVSLYLDAAHAGWLGWDANRAKIVRVFREVLDEAGGPDAIRGFATNVANFNTLGDGDGKRLEPSNPCPDELTYVAKLSASLAEAGIRGKGFIIDTSRNGRGGIRAKWGDWCNVKGAGLGERPRASPAPGVDAYFWVKPPGESDGASELSWPGYDAACATDASLPGAPHAGQWFSAYFLQLVANANPPL